MFLFFLACSNGVDEGAPFDAGEYEVSTVAMVDGCLDGALEALFMPNGRDTPQVFEFPIYLPGQDELPMTYDISLRAPFVGVEVTVSDGGEGVLDGVTGSIDEVLLNEPLYGDCGADMQGTVVLSPDSSASGTGLVELTLANFEGSEERCPTLDADPCPVQLDLNLSAL
jgi:hypothetical protein